MHEATDPLNIWAALAVRQARLSFKDALQEEDQRIVAKAGRYTGVRAKLAKERLERIGLALVQEAVERASNLAPTDEQARQAVARLCALFASMAQDVRRIAIHAGAYVGDAKVEVDSMLQGLEADLANGLRLAIPQVPTTAERNKGRERASVEQVAARLPVVTRAELQAWVRERTAAGDDQTTVERAFRGAFAGKVVHQDREAVREIYRQEYADLNGAAVRPGPRTRA